MGENEEDKLEKDVVVGDKLEKDKVVENKPEIDKVVENKLEMDKVVEDKPEKDKVVEDKLTVRQAVITYLICSWTPKEEDKRQKEKPFLKERGLRRKNSQLSLKTNLLLQHHQSPLVLQIHQSKYTRHRRT